MVSSQRRSCTIARVSGSPSSLDHCCVDWRRALQRPRGSCRIWRDGRDPNIPKTRRKMEENDNFNLPYFPQFLELFPLGSFKTSQQSQGSRRWRKAPGESQSRSRPILSSKRRSPGAPPVSSRLPGHNKRIEPDPSSCYENASQIVKEYG